MKKKWLFLLPLVLTGCASMNADFNSAVPEAQSNETVGVWTYGKSYDDAGLEQGDSMSLKINPNGTGVYCYSTQNGNNTGKLIVSGDKIITQNDGSFLIKNVSAQTLKTSGLIANMEFERDDALTNVNVPCADFLSAQQ